MTGLYDYNDVNLNLIFDINELFKFYAQLSWAWACHENFLMTLGQEYWRCYKISALSLDNYCWNQHWQVLVVIVSVFFEI